MINRSITIISIFIIIVVVGCSSFNRMRGSNNQETSEWQTHPPIPDGVSCYVCHKADIPQHEFHAKYGRDCSECHVTSTWIAAKYPHEEWPLASYHRTRCTRCHTKLKEHDFTAVQCWGCHHERPKMKTVHESIGITNYENCTACHRGTPPVN